MLTWNTVRKVPTTFLGAEVTLYRGQGAQASLCPVVVMTLMSFLTRWTSGYNHAGTGSRHFIK